jgi:5,10-methenyltetrahydrofolate synthetase
MSGQTANSGAEATLFRTQLRRERIAAREAIPADVHSLASKAIDAHLSDLFAGQAAGNIAFCWPVRGEFDCRPLVGRLLAAGWQACQPVVVTAAAPMVFRSWKADSPMGRDPHGIPIPATDDTVAPTVILLPLVGFDDQGYRLGYGGGYFDRTLAILNPRPLTIGVGFELARVSSLRPEAHDIPLDVVVTETGIRRFRR